MRVGLFIPCYMDAFEPEVGVATLELLERLGCSVEYPVDQTCCGQPMTNTGCHRDAAGAEAWAYTHPAFQTAHYAVFHTGPSATADIEGVLVHGAQGVRSLTVIVDG
jgi:Fe-S oxidoreductase